MKFISWNVNGLRACMQKGFSDFFAAADADFFMLQETKLQPHQFETELPGYRQYLNSAEKKGYSGTAIFTKHEPASVSYDFSDSAFSGEGRVITMEMPEFYIVNAYAPNAQDGLKRLPFRMRWEAELKNHLCALQTKKPVIYCGDLNVAHQEIDIKHPKQNRLHAGFSDEERAGMTALLQCGFIDTFRALYPDKKDAYTWWSYFSNARANNSGWRIDYFIVSQSLQTRIVDSVIHADVMGSDHCPIELILDL